MSTFATMWRRYLQPGSLPVLASLALTLAAAAIGLWQVILNPGETAAAVVVWLWGAIIAGTVFAGYHQVGRIVVWPTRRAKVLAWVVLVLPVICYFAGWRMANFFLLFAAVICYVGGIGVLTAIVVPLFLWLTVIPTLSYFHFLLSYPLRLIGSWLTVPVVRLFGIAVDGTGTVINMGGKEVAVTAACSGIEQLEAMLLVGWIIVMVQHRGRLVRIMHFSLILPVIIFCNTIRLTVTLLLFHYCGDVAFNNTIHTVLGLLMVVMVAVIFLALQVFFPSERNRENLVVEPDREVS
ncbi:MAG: exosortase/archaeosortase family protein [Victivallales bacterium]|nr:exosortase/archaeosortase family protein [Victivallales bacterium]